MALIKAILRRSERTSQPDPHPIQLADLTVDPLRRTGRVLLVTPWICVRRNLKCYSLWPANPGVYSRANNCSSRHGVSTSTQTRTVDVHIAHLRKKMAGSTAKYRNRHRDRVQAGRVLTSSLRSRLWWSYLLVSTAALSGDNPFYLHNSESIHIPANQRPNDRDGDICSARIKLTWLTNLLLHFSSVWNKSDKLPMYGSFFTTTNIK